MGQQAEGFFVLDVNPETGETTQIPSPAAKANYPTATQVASSGIRYIGAAYQGHAWISQYDPTTRVRLRGGSRG